MANKFEEIKAEKHGLDVWPDIERYAVEGYEAIADDDKVRMKWYGVFARRHIPGFFMLRIRIPGGVATSEQLRALASVASDFARGEIDLTTREQVQIRWYRIESVLEMVARLKAVGIDTRQTGMDNVRNVMTCPLTGVSSRELVDTLPVVRAMNAAIVGNRTLSSLPRKFNVTITGCIDNCLPVETQDISMVPASRTNGGQTVHGFNVLVGGKSGSGGLTPAQSLNVFVEPHEAVEVGTAIISLFGEFGSRQTRSEARLYFLLEAWGIDRFRSQLESFLGRELTPPGQDARQDTETDHLGIEPQRTAGSFSVGMAIPSGKLTSAHALELADLAEKYGRAEVRFTATQNVILPHVGENDLPSLLGEPLLRDLRPDPLPALRGTVACTGLGTCDLALANTKEKSLEVATQIDTAFKSAKPLSISWSGCPAACTNHRCATIGVQGDKARVNNEVVEVYHVFVNGRSGKAARAGVRVLEDVPADRIGDVLERLARVHSDGGDLEAAGLAIAAAPLPAPTAETILA